MAAERTDIRAKDRARQLAEIKRGREREKDRGTEEERKGERTRVKGDARKGREAYC